MTDIRNIQGKEITLSQVKVFNDLFEYHFVNSKQELIRISVEGDNLELAWEKLESEMTKILKEKLLDFVFYHGPISGSLSMLETETVAKGVLMRIDGIKTPMARLASDYATDDKTLAQMLANAYNSGVRDTQKLNQ